MAEELLLIILKNFVEDGCWHSDGEGIFEDCANLDCHECFVAKAKPIIEKQERERIGRKIALSLDTLKAVARGTGLVKSGMRLAIGAIEQALKEGA